MINGVMRDGWGFDGFVVSDCDAISDDATRHYIVSKFSNGSLQVQAQQAIRGGTDLNCGALYGEQNALAVRNGLLYETELDISLQRIYEKAFQLGVIDSASPGGGADHPNANPYVLDAVCFVYTCRRLIDLSLIAGTQSSARKSWTRRPTALWPWRVPSKGMCCSRTTSSHVLRQNIFAQLCR